MYFKVVIIAGAEAMLCLWLAYTMIVKAARSLRRADRGQAVADWVTIIIGCAWGIFQIIKMAAMLQTMI